MAGAYLASERSGVSPKKARKILKDGKVRGRKLSRKQQGMFGAIAGRKRPHQDYEEGV